MAQEKRAYARIAVPVIARVVIGSQETELVVRDISRSGIFLYTKTPPGVVGSTVTLKLSLPSGIKPVVLKAKIVRIVTEPSPKGRVPVGFGAHFAGNDAAAERTLGELLERSMLGPGTRSRAYPRVYHLLDVRCRTKEELTALMRDIGEGGAGLTMGRPLTKDEEVFLEITRSRPFRHLSLKGWVVSCETVTKEPPEYRVGIRFARQSDEMHKALLGLIAELVNH